MEGGSSGSSECKCKAWGRVKVTSWRKLAIKGSGTGERAPLQIKAERINSRLGSLEMQARRRAASWYRESDSGYDGLGGQARCATRQQRARRRSAGLVGLLKN